MNDNRIPEKFNFLKFNFSLFLELAYDMSFPFYDLLKEFLGLKNKVIDTKKSLIDQNLTPLNCFPG